MNGTLLPTSEVRGLFDRGNRPSPVGSTRSKKFKHRTFVLPPDRNTGSAAWPVVPPLPSLGVDSSGEAGPTPDFLPTARPMPPVRVPSPEETEDVGRENRVDAQRDTTTDRQQHSSNWLLMLLPIPIAVVLSLFCGSVIFLAFQRYKRNERRSIIKSASQKLPLEFENSSRETSISSVSTDCNPVDVVRGKRSFKNRYQTSDDDFPSASLAFTPNDGWEFPRQNLRFTNCMLGEGNFGLVWRCEALDFYQSGQSQAVAVKTLKRSHSSKELRDLLSEIEIMKMLDPHPYVVRLLGCCSDAEPVYLIMEYVPYGKLQDFLRKSRKDVENGVSAVTSEQLTSFAYQIAAGMEYISSKKVTSLFLRTSFTDLLIQIILSLFLSPSPFCLRSFIEISLLVISFWEKIAPVRLQILDSLATSILVRTTYMRRNPRYDSWLCFPFCQRTMLMQPFQIRVPFRYAGWPRNP